MKPNHLLTTLLAIGLAVPAARAANWTTDLKEGTPAFKSMGPISFGPEGILFIADTKSAAITAVATGDTKASSGAKPLKIEAINQKIAGLVGASAEQLIISDIAVNPSSRNVYLAVSRGRGPDAIPVLIRATTAGELEMVALDKVKFSRADLPDAPADGGQAQAGRETPRQQSITDIAFLEDRLLVAGLSNEEFASTLRAIPFPFKTVGNGASVEIYHGAHGKFETRAPVRTFVPFKVGNEASLLAAYTCTPLVQFPLSDLKPGAKIKGKTIAELGNRNRPLDMIVYQKGGKDYLLLANNSRGVMKINTDHIASIEGITSKVPDGDKKGLAYETIESWKGVDQLDQIDSQNAVVLRKGEGGAFTLEALPLP